MPRLPDVASVPQASVGALRSPAIAGPRVQPSGLEVAGDVLVEISDRMAKAEQRVRSREDTLARVKADGAFARSVEEEIARVETEDDLSDPQALTRFGKFLKDTYDQTLTAHTGSEDSRARLAATLEGRINEARSVVAGRSVKAQRNVIRAQFGDSLNGMVAAVVDSPSRMAEMFERLDGKVDDLAPGLSAEEELQFRNEGRQEIALSAVQSLVDRGDADGARELLADFPGATRLLSPEQARRMQSRILAVEQARTRAVREAEMEIRKTEIILGRSMTAAERVRKAGLEAPAGKKTLADHVQELRNLGIEPSRDHVLQLAGLDADDPLTDAGKYVADRERFVAQYGANSPQVKAFDEAAATTDVKQSDIAGMRKEFTTQSKDFVLIRDAFSRISEVSKAPDAAGDLAMIFNFMKMLDPGSTVREGEFANAQNAAGVPGRVRNTFNRLMTGERLAPEQRDQFIGQARNLMIAQLGNQTRSETEYERLAKDAGFKTTDVVIDYVGQYREFQSEGGAGTPAGSEGAPTYNLNGERVGGGNAVEDASPAAGPDTSDAIITSPVDGASATATGPDGRKAFLVDGEWLYEDGTEVEQ